MSNPRHLAAAKTRLESEMTYADQSYWRNRSDSLYYRYLEMFVRCLGVDAKSLIDVGSGNCPYLDWFTWIRRKVSVDITAPYSSDNVESIVGNILDLEFRDKFDLCTCFQVLEHVKDPSKFAKRLLSIGEIVLVSVPHRWPAGSTKGHVNDPVDRERLESWFERGANYVQVVQEPFRRQKSERLFAIFDTLDSDRRFGAAVWDNRWQEGQEK